MLLVGLIPSSQLYWIDRLMELFESAVKLIGIRVYRITFSL